MCTWPNSVEIVKDPECVGHFISIRDLMDNYETNECAFQLGQTLSFAYQNWQKNESEKWSGEKFLKCKWFVRNSQCQLENESVQVSVRLCSTWKDKQKMQNQAKPRISTSQWRLQWRPWRATLATMIFYDLSLYQSKLLSLMIGKIQRW